MLHPRAQLKTARLTLRPVLQTDRAAVVAALNDLRVSRWLSSLPHPYGEADFNDFFKNVAIAGKTFTIETAQGFAGICGIENKLGYWLAPQAWGNGYAFEAAQSVLANRFVAYQSPVSTYAFADNAPSRKILAKLGFVAIGQSEKLCRALGTARAYIDYSLTFDQFVAALPVLASDRLTYRDLLPHDAPALHALVSQWQVVRQLGSYPWPADPSVTLTKSAPYLGEGFEWGIFLHRQLVGTVGIHKGELGYMIDPAHHRKGYGREAARFAMRRSKLAHIEAEVWQDNLASKSLLESLGFEVLRPTQHMSKARGVLTGGIRLVWRGATPWARPSR